MVTVKQPEARIKAVMLAVFSDRCGRKYVVMIQSEQAVDGEIAPPGGSINARTADLVKLVGHTPGSCVRQLGARLQACGEVVRRALDDAVREFREETGFKGKFTTVVHVPEVNAVSYMEHEFINADDPHARTIRVYCPDGTVIADDHFAYKKYVKGRERWNIGFVYMTSLDRAIDEYLAAASGSDGSCGSDDAVAGSVGSDGDGAGSDERVCAARGLFEPRKGEIASVQLVPLDDLIGRKRHVWDCYDGMFPALLAAQVDDLVAGRSQWTQQQPRTRRSKCPIRTPSRSAPRRS